MFSLLVSIIGEMTNIIYNFELTEFSLLGNWDARPIPPMARNTSMMYAAYPHAIWYCIEKDSRLLARTGVTIRPMETKVCASPLVAPKDRLLGEAAVIYI